MRGERGWDSKEREDEEKDDVEWEKRGVGIWRKGRGGEGIRRKEKRSGRK